MFVKVRELKFQSCSQRCFTQDSSRNIHLWALQNFLSRKFPNEPMKSRPPSHTDPTEWNFLPPKSTFLTVLCFWNSFKEHVVKFWALVSAETRFEKLQCWCWNPTSPVSSGWMTIDHKCRSMMKRINVGLFGCQTKWIFVSNPCWNVVNRRILSLTATYNATGDSI